MTGTAEPHDSRLNVARYQVDRLTRETAAAVGEEEPEQNTAGQPTMEQYAAYVEISIQQAMRRGDFDNLDGAGKPLVGLNQAYDPNWWIRQKIERERLTGLGPPALTLRTEDASLDDRLDAAGSETSVREILGDFNTRIVEARRQLQGGPPVVTPTRDIDTEVAAWRERRIARLRAAEQAREHERQAEAAMTWAERRRARRQ